MRNERLSPKRERVLRALSGRTDHPTAEDLYRSLAAQGEEISLATVYRALGALAEEGLVAELRLGGPARYDPEVKPHHHFECRSCSRVYD
ncbi:MAG: transcriptional repressor, partial [Candidatus Bipolaricaulota bacterium]|nr:transcriptional repressor [Candidatus Bipolaricaulota bacterium]